VEVKKLELEECHYNINMSEIKVNTLKKRNGSTITIGESGDTVTITPGITAASLTSGTIPDARFPATLPAVSGANLTNLPAETKPTITNISPSAIDADVGGTVTLTGANYASIPKVELQRANGAVQSATSVTFSSATTISFTTGTAGLTNGQNVRIIVTNPDGNAVRSGTDLVISDGPVFTTTSLPNGESGQSYSQNIDVTGDSAVTIGTTVVAGALPSGVTIGSTTNPSGNTYRAVISGTLPTVTSETQYSFTVRATDAEGQTTDQAFTITSEVGITNSGGFC